LVEVIERNQMKILDHSPYVGW